MYEIISFNISVVMEFEDLSNNFKDLLFEKIKKKNFQENGFQVIEVLGVNLESSPIKGDHLICQCTIKAKVFFPRIGQHFEFENYEIKGSNIVIRLNDVQLIAPNKNNLKTNTTPIQIKILATKRIMNYLLCVAEII